MANELGVNLEKIRGLRAEKGLNQDDLAEVLGISTTSYNLKEQGKRQFTVNELGKIARYFDVEVDVLFKKFVGNN